MLKAFRLLTASDDEGAAGEQEAQLMLTYPRDGSFGLRSKKNNKI